ncbi:hypothetical protein MMC29_001927 [Sticta canariensis]|nr:hypothetical protein [Sticta canariensis]
MPYLDAEFEAIYHAATTGACDTKREIGVQVSSKVGAELSLEAAKVDNPSEPFLKLEIAKVEFPLSDDCLTFGPLVGGGGSTKPPPGGDPAPPPPAGGGDPPPSDPGNANAPTMAVNPNLDIVPELKTFSAVLTIPVPWMIRKVYVDPHRRVRENPLRDIALALLKSNAARPKSWL